MLCQPHGCANTGSWGSRSHGITGVRAPVVRNVFAAIVVYIVVKYSPVILTFIVIFCNCLCRMILLNF